MKSSATIKRLPRRWSSRSRRYETCNLHGEPHEQVACRLRYSTSVHSQSLRYFSTMTNTQTSTHSDDPLHPYLHEVSSTRLRPGVDPAVAAGRSDDPRRAGLRPAQARPLPNTRPRNCQISVT